MLPAPGAGRNSRPGSCGATPYAAAADVHNAPSGRSPANPHERMNLRPLIVLTAVASLAVPAPAWTQDAEIASAEQLFARYVALEDAHDPAIADLYADQAFVKIRRSMPMGDPQDVVVPAEQYRALLRQNMPLAKARGVRSAYSNVTYKREGEFVRIDAVRVSEPGRKTSPLSLLVGPSPGGKWFIYEQLSESRQ